MAGAPRLSTTYSDSHKEAGRGPASQKTGQSTFAWPHCVAPKAIPHLVLPTTTNSDDGDLLNMQRPEAGAGAATHLVRLSGTRPAHIALQTEVAGSGLRSERVAHET